MLKKIVSVLQKLWSRLKGSPMPLRHLSLVLLGAKPLVTNIVGQWNESISHAGAGNHKPPPLVKEGNHWKSRLHLDGRWHDLIVTDGDPNAQLPDGPLTLLLVVPANGQGLEALMTQATTLAQGRPDVKAELIFAQQEQFDDQFPSDPRLFRQPSLGEHLHGPLAGLPLLARLAAPDAKAARVQAQVEAYLGSLPGHSPGVLVDRWRSAAALVEVLSRNQIELVNAYVLVSNPAGPTPALTVPCPQRGAAAPLLDAIDFSRDRLHRPAALGAKSLAAGLVLAAAAIAAAVMFGQPGAAIRRYRQLIDEKGFEEVQQTALESQGFSVQLQGPIPQARFLSRINDLLNKLAGVSGARVDDIDLRESELALAHVGGELGYWSSAASDSSPEAALLADGYPDFRFRRLLRRVRSACQECQQVAAAVKTHASDPDSEQKLVAAMAAIASAENAAQGLRYLDSTGAMRPLQNDVEQWLRRLSEEMIRRQPQDWHRALLAAAAAQRDYLRRLGLPANPWGMSLAEYGIPAAARHEVVLSPSLGGQWLELRLRGAGGEFALFTNTLASYPIRGGKVDYREPLTPSEVTRQSDGTIKLDASALALIGIRVAEAPDFTLTAVDVLVDGRAEPTLLRGLATGLKQRHSGLDIRPAGAAPLITEALSPLSTGDPWGRKPPDAWITQAP